MKWTRIRFTSLAAAGGMLLRLLAAGGALTAMLTLGATTARAASFTVTTTNDTVDAAPGNGVCADATSQCSLRAAVMEANALSGADLIVLPAGTYHLTRGFVNPGDGLIEADAANGDLDLNSDITIQGAGAATTIIDGSALNDGVMDVNSALVRAAYLGQPLPPVGNVVISGVTIQGGHSTEALQNGGEGGGVGVYLWGSQGGFVIQNSVIQNNRADHGYGGGIGILNGQAASSVEATTVQITDTSFLNNLAYDAAGGGLFAGGFVPVTISGATVTGNTSGGANPRNLVPGGGGLFLEYDRALSTITRTTIAGNTTNDGTADDSDGGGMVIARGVAMMNSTVSGNTADRNGGGIDLVHTGALQSTFTNVTISGNSAYRDGAGIHVQLQNAAGQLFAPQATLTNVTIAGNRSDSDGNNTGTGGGVYRQNTDGTLTLQNTIVAGNYAGTGTAPSDAAGSLTGTYNLFGTGGSGTLAGGAGNLFNVADPRLGPLQDNGGPVWTRAPLPGSPALDAGSGALNAETTDARGSGFARVKDAADADATDEIDMGAYEAFPVVEDIADATVLQDTQKMITFNLGDANYAGGTIDSVTATSGDPAHVPDPAISGSGSTRDLTFTPMAGWGGGAPVITVTVTGTENGRTFTSTDTFVLTVQKRADLTMAKTHATPPDWRQGDSDKPYTITVANAAGAGPVLAPADPLLAGDHTVRVTDTLPAGLTPKTATGTGWSCTVTGQDVACARTVGSHTLAGGSSYPAITVMTDVAFDAGTPADNVLENTATVTGGGDNTPATNSATDPTTITLTPDLTVSKSHADPFRQGETNRAYTLTVTNSGPGPTDSAYTVTDTLPAGLTYAGFSGTGWSCSVAGQTVTCTGTAPLAAGGSSTLTLLVDVARDAATGAPHELTNTAAVAGGGELTQRAGNNTASPDLTTVSQMPDLEIAKTAGTFWPGQQAAYTLTVSNTGFAPTSGTVTVADVLDASLTYVSATGTGWTCSYESATRTVTCESTDAVADGSSFQAITLTVAVSATAPGSLTNTATVAGGGQIWVDAHDTASVTSTVIQAPDLVVSKSHTGDFVQGQQSAAYTITVSNQGSSITSGTVTVTDTLPAGLTPVPGGATGTGWTCTISGQTVECTRSDALAAGSSYEPATILVDVAVGAPATVTNTAAVSGGNDAVPGNNTDDDATAIGQKPDLTVTKSHAGDFRQGETGATYTIRVANSGTGPTDQPVTVTDTLPAGLTVTAMSGTGWTCDTSTVTCSRSDVLAAGAFYPDITLTVTVANNAGPSLTNSVTVSGGGEAVTANNTASDVTTVIQVADLTIAKSHSGTWAQGQTGATYSLTVSNLGPGPTDAAVTVTDTLPAGLTPTAAAGTGWTCALAGQTVTCTRSDTLAPNASYPPITLTADVAPTAPASLTNTASVAGGGEIRLDNDTASDPASIAQRADLTVTKSHFGDFWRGRQNAQYSITVTNAGHAATTAPVTVTDLLPAGLTAVQWHGQGWNCDLPSLTCTRSDLLAPAASYPELTLFVDVAANAASSVTNRVTVSGGGQVNAANDTAQDPTAINDSPPPVPTPRQVTITAPVHITREATVTVSGTANPGASILVSGLPVQVGSSGHWSATVALQEGPNQITAVNGDASASVTVVRKSIPPQLQFSASAYVTTADTVVLTATSPDPAVRTNIEGQETSSLTVSLHMGTNRFTATATDEVGNTATASLEVNRVKPPPAPATIVVEPGKPAAGGTDYLQIRIPGFAIIPFTVTIQESEPSDALRQAEAAARLLVLAADVNATETGSGHPVHNLPGMVTLIFSYDPAQVPDPAALRVYYYDTQGQVWVDLGGVVDAAAHTITVQVDHFTTFAVLEPAQQVPVLDGLPAAVNRPRVTVSGQGSPGAVLTVMVNGSAQGTATADQAGRFTFEARLAEGENRIYVKGVGALASTEVTVTYRPAPPLSDVAGHWAAGAIDRMVEAGVVMGYEDGTFRPENPVSRVEFAVMLARLLKLAPAVEPPGFTDAIPDWAVPLVSAAVKARLILGFPDGTFRPDAPITRAEAAVMSIRALQLQGRTVMPGDALFADQDRIPDWALEQVRAGVRSGLITGYPDGTFRPDRVTTRAEAVTFLSRLADALGQ